MTRTANRTSFVLGLALIGALVLPLSAALAAEAPAKDPKDQGTTDVELPAILAPMVVDNRLESYAYITVALTPTSRERQLLIREKMPFLRDGFLREVNKASIASAGDPKMVDQPALKKRLLARVSQILPPGTVSDLKFPEIVMTAIQPQP
jgi:flagellar basal body-associated protein FliL